MAWNDNPKVRALGAYADRYRFGMVICVGITAEGIDMITYGKNAKLCDVAADLGQQIYHKIKAGEIEPNNTKAL